MVVVKKSIIVALLGTSLFQSAYAFKNLEQRNQPWHNPSKNWFESSRVSGLIFGEIIHSNYNQSTGQFLDKRSYSIFCFPRANLYIDNTVNKYVRTHMAFNFRSSCCFGAHNDESANRKFDKVDSVYTDIHKGPYYARIGIQYLPYGSYKRNTIPASFTQLLSQTQAGAIVIGTTNKYGLNYAGFIFSGKPKLNHTKKINNIGATLSYNYQSSNNKFITSIDWIYNIAGAVNRLVTGTSSYNPLATAFRKKVDGLHFNFKYIHNKFDLQMQATTALQKFAIDDLKWRTRGAKPAAITVDLGYSCSSCLGAGSRIGLSYQRSFEAVNIKSKGSSLKKGLPKQRWQGSFSKYILKNTEIGAHLIWTKDYAVKNGGTGNDNAITYLVSLKLYLE